MKNVVILIPTYNPTDKLVNVILNLKKNGFTNIIIVDDGSLDKEIFSKIDVSNILVHNTNMGKGVALKTGFKYISKLGFECVITIDDDFQQDTLDVVKVANAFLKEKGIYFGVRSFEDAPFMRKMANKVSSKLFKLIYKEEIIDTQTGLRCFPNDILSDLALVKGDRFEYEMNVLKYLVNNKIEIKEIPIKTIYNDGGSHYNSLKDSCKILKVLFDKNNF